MGNIKTYDWFSENGEFEARTIIYEEFFKDGEKYCKIIEKFNFDNLQLAFATARETENGLELVKSFENESVERIDKENDDFEVTEISDELSDKIKEEQKENFRLLNDMLEVKLDLDRVNELIDQVNICGKVKKGKSDTQGFYKNDKNLIGLNLDIIESDEEDAKVVRLHEFIHLIQTLDPNTIFTLWNEAQVEDLAETLIFSNSKKENNKRFWEERNGKGKYLLYDAQATPIYTQPVIFLKQMEVALGRKFYEKNFANRIGFYKDFADKYGEELASYIYARINRLENSRFKDLDDEAEYIKETENTLFREVFDKDLERVDSKESAIDILGKMLEMKKYRQEIYVFSSDKSNYYDDFHKLYDEYYKRIGRKLAYLGCSKMEVLEALEPYKYDNLYIKDDFAENIDEVVLGIIKNYEEKNETTFDANKIGIRYVLGNYKEFIYQIYQKEQDRVISIGLINSDISAKRRERNIEDENSIASLIKSNFKPILDNGKRFKDIDVKRYLEMKREEEREKEEK